MGRMRVTSAARTSAPIVAFDVARNVRDFTVGSGMLVAFILRTRVIIEASGTEGMALLLKTDLFVPEEEELPAVGSVALLCAVCLEAPLGYLS